MKKIFYVLCASILLFSCEKNDLETNTNTTKNKLLSEAAKKTLNHLIEVGYDEKEIIANDEFEGFTVSDVVFPYNMSDYFDKNNENATSQGKNRWIGVRVDHIKSRDIKYYIDEKMFPADHIGQLSWAFRHWNLSSKNIHASITKVKSEADIICTGYKGPRDGVRMTASSPDGSGNVGKRIRVNLNNLIPATNKLSRMVIFMHEIGHTLGYLHADQKKGIKIPGTNGATWHTENRCGSIMRSNVDTCDWTFTDTKNWSDDDITSIDAYYGYVK